MRLIYRQVHFRFIRLFEVKNQPDIDICRNDLDPERQSRWGKKSPFLTLYPSFRKIPIPVTFSEAPMGVPCRPFFRNFSITQRRVFLFAALCFFSVFGRGDPHVFPKKDGEIVLGRKIHFL